MFFWTLPEFLAGSRWRQHSCRSYLLAEIIFYCVMPWWESSWVFTDTRMCTPKSSRHPRYRYRRPLLWIWICNTVIKVMQIKGPWAGKLSMDFSISWAELTQCISQNHTCKQVILLQYIMIRTYGAYRCFATIMIKFAVRQLCKHIGSLALIISCIFVFRLQTKRCHSIKYCLGKYTNLALGLKCL